MAKFLSRAAAMSAFLALLGQTSHATAEILKQSTVLSVRFSGIPVGKAQFDIFIDGESYKVEASGKTAGIVDMFAPGKGQALSEGQAKPGLVLASMNKVNYTGKDEKSKLDMTFSNGDVDEVKLETSKPRDKSGPKWVPVTSDLLKSVIDPASSLVIPVSDQNANNGRAVCNRTMKIYDGDARYDMVLSYKRTQIIKTKGYGGYAYVCKLKYVPLAGHKRGQKNIEYMTKNEGMELWLAPIAKKPVFTVIRVEVPTWLGQVTALPEKFVSSTQ